MKKTLVVMTSLATFGACTQVDTVGNPDTSNNKGTNEVNEMPNPFMPSTLPITTVEAHDVTNEDPQSIESDETSNNEFQDLAELIAQNDGAGNATGQSTNNDDGKLGEKIETDGGGWVVFANQRLTDDDTEVDHVSNVEIVVDEQSAEPSEIAGSNETDADDGADVDALPVPFEIALEGKFSGITSQQFTVIRDQVSFDTVWQEHLISPNAPAEKPVVDFNNDMLVAIFRGTISNCTETLTIDHIDETDTITVHATLHTGEPDAQCLLAQQNFVFVKIAQSDKIVDLKNEIENGVYVEPTVAEKISAKVELLQREIVDAIGTAECTYDEQCAALPIGIKSCGGPQSYLAYSSYNTNVPYLLSLVQAQKHLLSELNNQQNSLSDCMAIAEPVVSCKLNKCDFDSNNVPSLSLQ